MTLDRMSIDTRTDIGLVCLVRLGSNSQTISLDVKQLSLSLSLCVENTLACPSVVVSLSLMYVSSAKTLT